MCRKMTPILVIVIFIIALAASYCVQPAGKSGESYFSLRALSFSPDGKTLATGSGNGTVFLWNCSSQALPWKMASPPPMPWGGSLRTKFSVL